MDAERHVVTLHALASGAGADRARGEIARALGGGSVGEVAEGQMLELEVSAPSREEALRVVRDAITAAGADQLFTFPETIGSGHRPPDERAPAPDERPRDPV